MILTSLNRVQSFTVFGWLTISAALVSAHLVLGVPPSLSAMVAFFVLWSSAATVLLNALRGAPPDTIAQVLYDGEHATGASTRPLNDARVPDGILSDLHHLAEALDRRVPHPERSAEAGIARDAADLRRRTLDLIRQLEQVASR